MKLATLQNQFAKALHYQALGDDCDIASDQFTADERMQIYRNNFIISLSEVLSATYPMVEALLGETCFAQIAR
ncbi:DNA-binding domain-containing protein, partial [Vibrio parahaemolyticus]|nr:DNA-binding domain-containing protein [Vibrio parahaemolyticus]